MHRATWITAGLIALASVACSSGGDSRAGSTPAPSVDGGRADAITDEVTDAAAVDCDDAIEDRLPGSVCVHEVRGNVTDLDGAPLKSTTISVCGQVCYFARTNDSGRFQTHIGHYILPVRFQLLVHGRPDHASMYLRLPTPSADGYVDMPSSIAVPTYDVTGPPLPADDAPSASTLTVGDLTLRIPAGTEFDLDVEDVANGVAGRLVRSVKWKTTALPDFVAGIDVAALYALAPFNSFACTKAPCAKDTYVKLGVSLKNTTTLAPGTAVEFFVLGTELYSVPPNAGRSVVQATGKVSADGKTIDTDVGQGISELSFLGVRAKS